MSYLFSNNIAIFNSNNAAITPDTRLPVDIGNTSINISGNVNINLPNTITVNSSSDNPVHVHISEIGLTNLMTYTYMPVGGNVSIFNSNGSAIANATPLPITGNVVVTSGNISVSGIGSNVTVSVNNFPATQTVNGSVTVSGNVNANVSGVVNVGNLPAIQTVNGSVSVSGNISGISSNVTVTVNNFPSTQNSYIFNSNGAAITNTTPLPITGNVTATLVNNANTPALVKFVNSTNVQLDVNQRLRVAVQGQQYWYSPTVDKDGDVLYSESFTGAGANSYFVQNIGGIRITPGNTYSSNTSLTGRAIRASRRRHKMRPGASHQWFSVHNWGGTQAEVVKRRGMFTNFNGIFFEVSDDMYIVIRRRLIDGTLVERRIARNDFNVDKFDGTGISGYDFRPTSNSTLALTSWANTVSYAVSNTETVYNVRYNATSNGTPFELGTYVTVTGIAPVTFNGVAMLASANTSTVTLTYQDNPGTYTSMSSGVLTQQPGFHFMHSWYFDFSGGSTARIRFGINGSEGPQLCHTENFAGELGTHFQNASALMDRTEIFNTGNIVYPPSMTISGTSINVEAELELSPGFGTAHNNIGVAYTKTRTDEFAVLGIGLRAGEPYQRGDVQIQSLQLSDLHNINQQNSGVFFWRLLLNPVLGGDFTGNGSATEIRVGKATRYWQFTTNTTFSNGIELLSGYYSQGAVIDIKAALNFLSLGSNIQYTDADKVVLVVKCLAGGSADSLMVAQMNFIEAL